MSQWDRDPATGDYVVENGAPVNTDSLRVPAYIRLRAHREGWLYAPSRDFGSAIADVKKLSSTVKDTLLENLHEQALAPLIADGRASTITAETIERARGGRAVRVTIVDRQNKPEDFDFAPIGG